jgi:copper ion binding protein
METKKVRVPNISCGHCVATIERELATLDGVAAVKADVETKEVVVKWTDPATWQRIEETLREIGYPPEG